MSYTYQIEGVTIKDERGSKPGDLLETALGVAAVYSFQNAKPVILLLNGVPYRRISVEWVESLTRRPKP